MKEEEIISAILNEAFYIHKSIGPGLLESVYQNCLAYRLQSKGFGVEVEKAIPVIFEEVKMECGYRADLIIDHRILVEIKSVSAICDVHKAQVLTYLRFLHLRHGLLLNFDTVLLKDGIKRILNGF